MSLKQQSDPYQLNPDGSFVIQDYNHAKVFANFFPGIAGIWGIPMWVFYINRGQGISSFGIESKDKAILEFHPANKAYRTTSLQGFRTFVKVKKGKAASVVEPFANHSGTGIKSQQRMIINPHDLTIEEVNQTLGLKFTVNYFTVPEESFSALVRRVTIENISKIPKAFELIDGLPAIVPYGYNDWLNKHISRTIEAWIKVRNIKNKAPYYQLNVEVSDTPQVTHITEGNFYFTFDPSVKGKDNLLPPVVESAIVFGQSSDFVIPEGFQKDGFRIPEVQQTSNRTPSAMSYAKVTLKPGQTKQIISLAGFANDLEQLNKIRVTASNLEFVEKKAARNREIIEEIKQMCFTSSASGEFNHYCGHTFLDNVLRGGLPVSLQTQEGPVAFNVYSRKHGDLERDYNFFTLAPTFLSQGNGNFRDVNQNRRNDVWFNGDVRDTSVINFFSLSQADGYNPLVVRGLSFSTDESTARKIVNQYLTGPDTEKIKTLMVSGCMPGDLLKAVQKHDVKLKVSAKEFITNFVGHGHKQELADHGEGFWSDHWSYNIDLLNSYLGLYPERLKSLLFDKRDFTFYLNGAYVQPRRERYVLTKKGVRQYHSVKEDEHNVHSKQKGNRLRVGQGKGDIYKTTLAVKLLCVLANKVATLDPSGIGIEMEADKPNWYDALNGLPGLLGSSISETFEVKRYAEFFLDSLNQLAVPDSREVIVFEELQVFVRQLIEILDGATDDITYWNQANDAKEHYRSLIQTGIHGEEKILTVAQIKRFLELIIKKTGAAVAKARLKDGLFATYYYHDVTSYETLDKKNKNDQPYVWPTGFKRHELPLFLEGFVHALRLKHNPGENRRIYAGVRKSALYDRKLGMYKVNADLSKETEEIGRTRIFPTGWLENGSIWLHMEYKYFLEVLRNGMYKEFYEEFKNAFIPFQPPARYGRNILENSSFLVSSTHEDAKLHGQGFVARLSGSTAEFLHMWLIMNAGEQPFRHEQGKLVCEFKPALSRELFAKQERTVDYLTKGKQWVKLTLPKNTYAFNFLGSTLVVYHNPKATDTFNPKAAIKNIALISAGSKPVEISGSTIPSPHAEDIRSGKVDRIDVYFA